MPSHGILAEGPPGGSLYQRYMHLTGVRAYAVAGERGIYLDALAARDLSRHTYFGPSVRVVCPIYSVTAPPTGTVLFRQDGFEFVALPHAKNVLSYVLTGRWFRAIWRMWRQLRWADIAFMGFVEHPIPYGWTAVPAAAIRRVPWYTFIESSPWRVPPGVVGKRRARVRAAFTEPVNRRLFRKAAFAFVSQPAYAEFLREDCPYLVSPASWFVREEMATESEIHAARAAAGNGLPHLMFVGRLDPSKGVEVLLEALALVDAQRVELSVTVMGSGQLQERVEQVSASLHHVQLRLAPTVLYGPDFFRQLRGVNAVVVPNLGDEQPRIVFDAFSQGVPVLAFDTSGLRSVVTHQVDGELVPVGDAEALAAAMAAFADPATRRRWIAYGDAGFQRAQQYDHDEMHRQRAEFVSGLAR